MTKYRCHNGYSSFTVDANSLTEVRKTLMRKLGLINGKAMFTVYKGENKEGVLIWDLNTTGKVWWFTEAKETVNIWGFKKKIPFRGREVNPDGSLGAVFRK